MALGSYTEGGIGSNSGGTPATSASFTPSAFSTVIVFGSAYRVFSDPGAPTISNSGTALTWTPIGESAYTTGLHRLYVRAWYTVVGGSPAAMTVSVASTSAGAMTVQCSYLTGADTDFSNQIAATDADGTFTATLSNAPASTSYATIGIAGFTNSGPTAPGGYAAFGNITAADLTFGQFHDVTTPGSSASSTDSGSVATAALMFEIKEPSAATASLLLRTLSPSAFHMLAR